MFKRGLIIVSFILLGIPAYTQSFDLFNQDSIPFAPAVNYSSSDFPQSIFCADLDGDEDLDLAIANYNSDNVSVLKNNGDGVFEAKVDYIVGDGPRSVFSADLDGDEDLDLAVANYDSDNVSILKNNGDGTFYLDSNYTVGDAPVSHFCADLDSDADRDLAVVNSLSDSVSILKNNGDATFQTKVNYGVGNNPQDIFCADLDGDSCLDLTVTNDFSDNVSILKNNGDGTFQTKVDYVVGNSPQSVCCSDLDGDLDFDLAVTNELGHSISILKNNGDGTFETKVDYAAGNYPYSVFCANLDEDTDLDLTVTEWSSDHLSIFRNNGDGTFQAKVDYNVGDVPVSHFCGDLDGDLDLDLAVANQESDNVSILRNLTISKGNILVYVTEDGTGVGYDRTYCDDDLPIILETHGYSVTVTDRIVTPEVNDSILNNYDQMWILSTNPHSDGCFDPVEVSAIFDFREKGHGLLITTDHWEYIADANQISESLGVEFYGLVIHGVAGGSAIVPDFESHPLFVGVDTIIGFGSEGNMYVDYPSEIVATHIDSNLIAIRDDGYGRVVFDVCCARLKDSKITQFDTPKYVRNIADWLMRHSPSPFSLLCPLNDDSIASPVTFDWQSSIDLDPDDTIRYDLYLSSSAIFNPDSTDTVKAMLDTTYTDNLELGVWYWKVKAYDTWSAVRWSTETWSFQVFLCGDVNDDEQIDLSDPICLANHYFGKPCDINPFTSDVNCDTMANLGDAIIIANVYFGKPGFELNCCGCP